VAALATSHPRFRCWKMRTAIRISVGRMRSLDFHQFSKGFADGMLNGRRQRGAGR
jgi:hypothetical protein